jgi:hypothetical protein
MLNGLLRITKATFVTGKADWLSGATYTWKNKIKIEKSLKKFKLFWELKMIRYCT